MPRHRTVASLSGLLTLAALQAAAFAAPPLLYPSTSNLTNGINTIQLYVSGTDLVSGTNVNVQINGGISGPKFTNNGLDILTGTIFATNNTGAVGDGVANFPPGPFNQYNNRFADLSTTTSSGTVLDNGLLATVVIDTSSSSGTFQLNLLSTINGTTNFVLPSSQIVPGTLPADGQVLKMSINNPDRIWNVNGGGTWGTDNNWTPFAPYANGDPAKFLGVVTTANSTAVITLDGSRVAGSLTFDNANASYAIIAGGGGGNLHLNDVAPSISVLSGSHSVNAPIVLSNNTSVAVSGGGQLTLGGNISGTVAMSFSNSGLTILSGSNSYGVTNIAANATVQVGAGGTTGTLGSGAVNNNGTLVFNHSAPLAVANPISGNGGLTLQGNTLTLTGAANYSGNTAIPAGRLIFGGSGPDSIGSAAGAGLLEAAVNLTSDGVRTAAWNVDANVTHTIRSNGSAAGVSEISALAIAGSTGAWTGSLDITNNALILLNADTTAQAANLSILQNEISYAKTHAGLGITSSSATTPGYTALALVDNGNLHLTSFRGVTGMDDNSLLVVRAHDGDANLDGHVNSLDLTTLANNWQKSSGALWSQGDFNNDGKVDSLDLTTIANNWQFSGTPLGAALAQFPQFGGSSSVPEPASLAVLAFGSAALLARRKRRASPLAQNPSHAGIPGE